MAHIGVILSGCGVMDGSEIHEAVLTLLFLDKAGATVHCFAPDKPQMHVVDHRTQRPTLDARNVLLESARIARGGIQPLSEINMNQLDAIIFPGGFGAAKNLCDFAVKGADCDVDPDVKRAIQSAYTKKKVIGAICIAPALVARALQDNKCHPVLTIGSDAATAGALRAMGAVNETKSVSEIMVDAKNRIVSTPAYMLGPSISKVAEGIEKLVEKVLQMVEAPVKA